MADTPGANGGGQELRQGDGNAALAIRLEYVPAPSDLQWYFPTFFLFRCDTPYVRDVQPAAMGQLQFYFSGWGGVIHYASGAERTHPITLMSPPTVAAEFEFNGPMHSFGVVLAPLGWMALTGMAANHNSHQLLDAKEIFGPEIASLYDRFAQMYAADPETDGSAMAEQMAQFLRARMRPLPPEHVTLVQRVVAWLGSALTPDVKDLYSQSGYSVRQTQRLVAQYFGASPKNLIRKYRATRVVARLNRPDVTDEEVAALTDEFYDQPHMIREIREFMGRTPKRFGTGDSPILETLVQMKNFYHIKTGVTAYPDEVSESHPAP